MEITDEQVDKIFELASIDKKKFNGEITQRDISEALIQIERKIYSFTTGIKIESLEDKKILIADDLELSIYQLSTILKKIGISPRVARSKEEAVSELHKAGFDCVIVDLFIPEAEDGLELIKQAVKKRSDSEQYLKIVVVSGTDDKSLIDKCYELGIDFYIQKDKTWHSKLLKYLSTTFQSDKNVSFTRYIINNEIASYVIKRFNDSKIFDELIKNINSLVYTGVKSILFDLKEITAFDIDNAYIFADIYKICAENGGKFVIANPSVSVKEALSFAYLEGIIPYAKSLEDAVSIIMESTKNSQ